MLGSASQRLGSARQRLQQKLLAQLSSTPARPLHSSTAFGSLASSTTRTSTTTLASSHAASSCPLSSPSPSRSFAKAAAAKGKEKAPAPKAVLAPKASRATTKPPHPSSIPPYPPHHNHIPHPHTATQLTSVLNPPGSDPPPYDPNDPVFRLVDPRMGPSRHQLHATAERYEWIDWSRFRDFIHRSDVHFFDNEVKTVDQNFYPIVPEEGEREFDEEEEAERAKQRADLRLQRLLPFSAFVADGNTTRVTRFGKVRSAWAMLIGGDRNGTASFGIGKGEDYMVAMKRAEQDLQKNLTFLPLIESRTILSETVGRFGVCEVHIKPLPRGAGMTAGIIPRLVFEAFGLYDISAKVYGRALPKHQVFAIWDALSRQRSMREWSVGRGIRAHRMFERGVQQPRAPPRAVLEQRAEAIHRKLAEAKAVLEDEQRKELQDGFVDREDEEDAEAYEDDDGGEAAEEERLASLGQVGPDGRVVDMDDVMDGDEADEIDKDRLNWGPWLHAPNYVPVLPPAKPFIPTPKPASAYGIQRGRNVWKKK